MILQKSKKLSISEIKSSDTYTREIRDLLVEYLQIENEYRFALRELSAKLENLDDFCQYNFDHNPIHHIESRIKDPDSIIEKMTRRGHNYNLKNLKKHIYDIAGIRVICKYINDIYQIIDLLEKQKDLHVMLRKDYISNPKSTGYRSFHIVFTIEVYINNQTKVVPVEIQFRTLAMDMWASLEHELRYKSNNELTDEQKFSLYNYSKDLYNIDLNMQKLYIETTVGKHYED
jgi:putative GTP pyrophosphokinase